MVKFSTDNTAARINDRLVLQGGEDSAVVRVLFREFSANFQISWTPAMKAAADFATGLGPDRLINISMKPSGKIVVWYWGKPETCPKCGYDLTGNASGRCPECGTQI